MAKIRRQHVEGQTYHTTSVTRSRIPFFTDARNARIVLEAISHVSATGKAYILAFAIMPDHLHLLLAPRDGNNVSTVMHSIKSFSASQIQHRSGVRGSIWQSSFLDRLIWGDEHLARTIEYIEHNPVAAGLVKEREQFEFSSAHPASQTDNEAFWGG